MNDFFKRLAERTLGVVPHVRPVPSSRMDSSRLPQNHADQIDDFWGEMDQRNEAHKSQRLNTPAAPMARPDPTAAQRSAFVDPLAAGARKRRPLPPAPDLPQREGGHREPRQRPAAEETADSESAGERTAAAPNNPVADKTEAGPAQPTDLAKATAAAQPNASAQSAAPRPEVRNDGEDAATPGALPATTEPGKEQPRPQPGDVVRASPRQPVWAHKIATAETIGYEVMDPDPDPAEGNASAQIQSPAPPDQASSAAPPRTATQKAPLGEPKRAPEQSDSATQTIATAPLMPIPARVSPSASPGPLPHEQRDRAQQAQGPRDELGLPPHTDGPQPHKFPGATPAKPPLEPEVKTAPEPATAAPIHETPPGPFLPNRRPMETDVEHLISATPQKEARAQAPPQKVLELPERSDSTQGRAPARNEGPTPGLGQRDPQPKTRIRPVAQQPKIHRSRPLASLPNFSAYRAHHGPLLQHPRRTTSARAEISRRGQGSAPSKSSQRAPHQAVDIAGAIALDPTLPRDTPSSATAMPKQVTSAGPKQADRLIDQGPTAAWTGLDPQAAAPSALHAITHLNPVGRPSRIEHSRFIAQPKMAMPLASNPKPPENTGDGPEATPASADLASAPSADLPTGPTDYPRTWRVFPADKRAQDGAKPPTWPNKRPSFSAQPGSLISRRQQLKPRLGLGAAGQPVAPPEKTGSPQAAPVRSSAPKPSPSKHGGGQHERNPEALVRTSVPTPTRRLVAPMQEFELAPAHQPKTQAQASRAASRPAAEAATEPRATAAQSMSLAAPTVADRGPALRRPDKATARLAPMLRRMISNLSPAGKAGRHGTKAITRQPEQRMPTALNREQEKTSARRALPSPDQATAARPNQALKAAGPAPIPAPAFAKTDIVPYPSPALAATGIESVAAKPQPRRWLRVQSLGKTEVGPSQKRGASSSNLETRPASVQAVVPAHEAIAPPRAQTLEAEVLKATHDKAPPVGFDQVRETVTEVQTRSARALPQPGEPVSLSEANPQPQAARSIQSLALTTAASEPVSLSQANPQPQAARSIQAQASTTAAGEPVSLSEANSQPQAARSIQALALTTAAGEPVSLSEANPQPQERPIQSLALTTDAKGALGSQRHIPAAAVQAALSAHPGEEARGPVAPRQRATAEISPKPAGTGLNQENATPEGKPTSTPALEASSSLPRSKNKPQPQESRSILDAATAIGAQATAYPEDADQAEAQRQFAPTPPGEASPSGLNAAPTRLSAIAAEGNRAHETAGAEPLSTGRNRSVWTYRQLDHAARDHDRPARRPAARVFRSGSQAAPVQAKARLSSGAALEASRPKAAGSNPQGGLAQRAQAALQPETQRALQKTSRPAQSSASAPTQQGSPLKASAAPADSGGRVAAATPPQAERQPQPKAQPMADRISISSDLETGASQPKSFDRPQRRGTTTALALVRHAQRKQGIARAAELGQTPSAAQGFRAVRFRAEIVSPDRAHAGSETFSQRASRAEPGKPAQAPATSTSLVSSADDPIWQREPGAPSPERRTVELGEEQVKAKAGQRPLVQDTAAPNPARQQVPLQPQAASAQQIPATSQGSPATAPTIQENEIAALAKFDSVPLALNTTAAEPQPFHEVTPSIQAHSAKASPTHAALLQRLDQDPAQPSSALPIPDALEASTPDRVRAMLADHTPGRRDRSHTAVPVEQVQRENPQDAQQDHSGSRVASQPLEMQQAAHRQPAPNGTKKPQVSAATSSTPSLAAPAPTPSQAAPAPTPSQAAPAPLDQTPRATDASVARAAPKPHTVPERVPSAQAAHASLTAEQRLAREAQPMPISTRELGPVLPDSPRVADNSRVLNLANKDHGGKGPEVPVTQRLDAVNRERRMDAPKPQASPSARPTGELEPMAADQAAASPAPARVVRTAATDTEATPSAPVDAAAAAHLQTSEARALQAHPSSPALVSTPPNQMETRSPLEPATSALQARGQRSEAEHIGRDQPGAQPQARARHAADQSWTSTSEVMGSQPEGPHSTGRASILLTPDPVTASAQTSTTAVPVQAEHAQSTPSQLPPPAAKAANPSAVQARPHGTPRLEQSADDWVQGPPHHRQEREAGATQAQAPAVASAKAAQPSAISVTGQGQAGRERNAEHLSPTAQLKQQAEWGTAARSLHGLDAAPASAPTPAPVEAVAPSAAGLEQKVPTQAPRSKQRLIMKAGARAAHASSAPPATASSLAPVQAAARNEPGHEQSSAHLTQTAQLKQRLALAASARSAKGPLAASAAATALSPVQAGAQSESEFGQNAARQAQAPQEKQRIGLNVGMGTAQAPAPASAAAPIPPSGSAVTLSAPGLELNAERLTQGARPGANLAEAAGERAAPTQATGTNQRTETASPQFNSSAPVGRDALRLDSGSPALNDELAAGPSASRDATQAPARTRVSEQITGTALQVNPPPARSDDPVLPSAPARPQAKVPDAAAHAHGLGLNQSPLSKSQETKHHSVGPQRATSSEPGQPTLEPALSQAGSTHTLYIEPKSSSTAAPMVAKAPPTTPQAPAARIAQSQADGATLSAPQPISLEKPGALADLGRPQQGSATTEHAPQVQPAAQVATSAEQHARALEFEPRPQPIATPAVAGEGSETLEATPVSRRNDTAPQAAQPPSQTPLLRFTSAPLDELVREETRRLAQAREALTGTHPLSAAARTAATDPAPAGTPAQPGPGSQPITPAAPLPGANAAEAPLEQPRRKDLFSGWSGGSFDLNLPTQPLKQREPSPAHPRLSIDPAFFARSWHRTSQPIVQMTREPSEPAPPPSLRVPVEIQSGRETWSRGWHRSSNDEVAGADKHLLPVEPRPTPLPALEQVAEPVLREAPARAVERNPARQHEHPREISIPTSRVDTSSPTPNTGSGPRQSKSQPELKVSIGAIKVSERPKPSAPKSHETACAKPSKTLDQFLAGG